MLRRGEGSYGIFPRLNRILFRISLLLKKCNEMSLPPELMRIKPRTEKKLRIIFRCEIRPSRREAFIPPGEVCDMQTGTALLHVEHNLLVLFHRESTG